jgi:ribose-phosphate pyrophosphokinase
MKSEGRQPWDRRCGQPDGLHGQRQPEAGARGRQHLNLPLGRAQVSRFSDGEVMVEILENVRGKDVFVLQSTCAPTNDNLMELMIMVDALKRASAGRITAAIPYFGYARQDRRPRSARVAISAKVVANMLQAVGVDRVLTMDLHADQIQGFFDIPVDNIYASPILLGDLWKHNYENLVVVSPDVGGVVRARALAKRLEADLAIIDKRRPRRQRGRGDEHHRRGRGAHLRDHGRHGRHRQHAVRGGRRAARARRGQGAGLLHAPGAVGFRAVERINASALDELVVTDTIPLTEKS